MITEIASWFLSCYTRGVPNTTGSLVLLVRMGKQFWRLLQGSRLIARYESGAPLFTSPDWKRLETEEGIHEFHNIKRVFRVNAEWPVVVIHSPRVLVGKNGDWSRGMDQEGQRCSHGSALPTLRKDPAHNFHLLPSVLLCTMF